MVKEKRKSPGYFDVEELASTYASYHDHPANQAIHFVCVPLLLFSLWLLLALVSAHCPAIASALGARIAATFGAPMSLSLVVAVAWGAYLACLHMAGGVATLAVFLALVAGAARTFAAVEPATCWLLVGVCQAVGWGAQVLVGHNYFEGKCNDNDAQPATATSLWINLVSPFFLVLENLFRVGLFPELAASVNAKAKAKIERRREERRRRKRQN